MHFSAAYSYGEEALRPLALLHYKTLLQFEPDYPMALNNVGVEYKHLGMPINAVKCYKKAAELNETLAMANIAYQFLEPASKKKHRRYFIKQRNRINHMQTSQEPLLLLLTEMRPNQKEKKALLLMRVSNKGSYLFSLGPTLLGSLAYRHFLVFGAHPTISRQK